MYDSVNRFEPTRIGSCAWTAQAATSRKSAPTRRVPIYASSEELQPREAGIQAVLANQLRMRTLRDDSAAIHDHDAVGMLHRREAMRDGRRMRPPRARREPAAPWRSLAASSELVASSSCNIAGRQAAAGDG